MIQTQILTWKSAIQCLCTNIHDLTNNIYQSNNAFALKLKQLENIQNTIHSNDQFAEQVHTLKYFILSLSITIIICLVRCIIKNKKLGKSFNQLYQFIKCINSGPSNIEILSISEPLTIKVLSKSVNNEKIKKFGEKCPQIRVKKG
jgi:hypothetical protein